MRVQAPEFLAGQERSVSPALRSRGIGAVTAALGRNPLDRANGRIRVFHQLFEADDERRYIGCTGERVLLRELGKSEREDSLCSDIRLSFATHGQLT